MSAPKPFQRLTTNENNQKLVEKCVKIEPLLNGSNVTQAATAMRATETTAVTRQSQPAKEIQPPQLLLNNKTVEKDMVSRKLAKRMRKTRKSPFIFR